MNDKHEEEKVGVNDEILDMWDEQDEQDEQEEENVGFNDAILDIWYSMRKREEIDNKAIDDVWDALYHIEALHEKRDESCQTLMSEVVDEMISFRSKIASFQDLKDVVNSLDRKLQRTSGEFESYNHNLWTRINELECCFEQDLAKLSGRVEQQLSEMKYLKTGVIDDGLGDSIKPVASKTFFGRLKSWFKGDAK